MAAPVVFGTGRITVSDLVGIARDRRTVVLDVVALERIGAARAIVERHLVAGVPVSGLNREFGAPRDTHLTTEDVAAFQTRIIRDHLGGVGVPMPVESVRAMIAARLAGWSRGGAGIRVETAVFYAELLNRHVVPVVPTTGSVGDGDLTQLAAVAAVAIGEGHAFVDGEIVPGSEALNRAGLVPLQPQAHEGLTLVGHNSYSLGVGALALNDLDLLARAADAAAALSFQALAALGAGGNPGPFSAALLANSPSDGAKVSGERIRALLDGGVSRPEVTVQDPLAFRTAPQVNGSFVDVLAHAMGLIEDTLAVASENPLVDAETASIYSGGLFHIVPVATALDSVRAVIAQVATSSERRLAAVSDANAVRRRNGTTRVPSLLWYASTDLVAELRVLATPVSTGGAALSGGTENVATFAATALRLLWRAAALLGDVIAIEALVAVDALGVLDEEDVDLDGAVGAAGAAGEGAGDVSEPRDDSAPVGGQDHGSSTAPGSGAGGRKQLGPLSQPLRARLEVVIDSGERGQEFVDAARAALEA